MADLVVCPDVAFPEAEPASSTGWDLDGDGATDEVLTFNVEGVWSLGVRFQAGGSALVEIPDADPFTDVRSIGAVDLSDDRILEVAMALGGGAYTQSIGFIAFRNCALVRLMFENETPASFLTGASVANALGIFCSAGVVEQFEFTLADETAEDGGPMFEGSFQSYQLIDDRFVAGASNESTLSEDELAAIDLLACGGLAL